MSSGVSVRKVQLKEIASVLNGFAFKSKEYVDSGFRIIRITNVQKGIIRDDDPKFVHQGRVEEFQKYMLEKGDILMSLTGNVGRVGIIDDTLLPAALNQRVGAIKIHSDEIAREYLFHVLNSTGFERDAIKNSNGIAQLNLSSKWVEAYEIPLPPLPEQKRIAAILDTADALRAKRKESIEQLDSLIHSTFLEMFGDPVTNPRGWPTEEAAAVVKEGTSITYGIVQAGEEFPSGIPYIRTGDIVNGEIVVEGLRRTDPAIAAKFARSQVDVEDIVMSIRATVGTTALVSPAVAGANLTQGTARIAPSKKVCTLYLLHFIRSTGCQRWIERQVKGATFKEITLTRLRQMPVMLPPVQLQTRFASIVESIEQQKTRLKTHLAELDTLFASLQSRAFNGEL